MGYIILFILLISAFVFYNSFHILKRSVLGVKSWNKCEIEFKSLLERGYDRKSALVEISKLSHPELSDNVHQKIVEKLPNVDMLANFIYSVLDFRPPFDSTFGGNLTDEHALGLLKHTVVSNNGRLNTDFIAVYKLLQERPGSYMETPEDHPL